MFCFELHAKSNDYVSFISKIITGDEILIYRRTKIFRSKYTQLKSLSYPWPKKACSDHNKNILIMFFDIKGFVHCEVTPQRVTIKSGLYCRVLKRFRRDVRRNRPEV